MNTTKNRPATVRIQRQYHPYNPAWDDWPTRPECRDCGLPLHNGNHREPDMRPPMVICVWPERGPEYVRVRVSELGNIRDSAELKLWVAASLDAAAQN